MTSAYRTLVAAIALAGGLAALPAAAQQETGELFTAAPDAPPLVQSWNGQPYIDVLSVCGGIAETYRQGAVASGKLEAAKRASEFIRMSRGIVRQRLDAAGIPYDPIPDIVAAQWYYGVDLSQKAVRDDRIAGQAMVANTMKACVTSIVEQERRMGRG